jgi:hypothetical protein
VLLLAVCALLLVEEERPILHKDLAAMIADDGMLTEEYYT